MQQCLLALSLSIKGESRPSFLCRRIVFLCKFDSLHVLALKCKMQRSISLVVLEVRIDPDCKQRIYQFSACNCIVTELLKQEVQCIVTIRAPE